MKVRWGRGISLRRFFCEGKKPGRSSLPADLKRERVIHDLPSSEKTCSRGSLLHKIGLYPSPVRFKYGCKGCEETVKLAPLPLQPIPKSIATSGMLAHVLVSKYVDHLPLYRQSKIWDHIGIDLTRGTMCNWVLQCGELLAPMVEQIIQMITYGLRKQRHKC